MSGFVILQSCIHLHICSLGVYRLCAPSVVAWLSESVIAIMMWMLAFLSASRVDRPDAARGRKQRGQGFQLSWRPPVLFARAQLARSSSLSPRTSGEMWLRCAVRRLHVVTRSCRSWLRCAAMCLHVVTRSLRGRHALRLYEPLRRLLPLFELSLYQGRSHRQHAVADRKVPRGRGFLGLSLGCVRLTCNVCMDRACVCGQGCSFLASDFWLLVSGQTSLPSGFWLLLSSSGFWLLVSCGMNDCGRLCVFLG